MGLSHSGANKVSEDAVAEEDIKRVAEEAAGEGEKSDEGALPVNVV